jgi:uncharacterized membrane protein YdjX (TVP38/TMEM64 family)
MENVMSESDESEISETPRKSWGKIGAVLLVVVGLIAVSQVLDIRGLLTDALAWIEGLGVLGMAVFLVLYVVACVFVLPGSILTLGAGAIFGLPIGFALVSVSSTLGATATFIIGRYLARDAVAKKISTNKTFKSMDDAVAQQGWKIVFLTRLTPVIPFNIQNYGYGLTSVSLGAYVLASWIGMMPGTVLFTYIGTLTGEAAEGNQGAAAWAMRGVALLATIAVTVVITRIAKKAMADAVTPIAENE